MDCTVKVVVACVASPLLLWLAYIALNEAMGAWVIGVIKKTLKEEEWSSAKYRPLHTMLEAGYEKISSDHIHHHKYSESHCSTEEVVALAKAVCHDEMKKRGG